MMLNTNTFAQKVFYKRLLNMILNHLGFSCFHSGDQGRHALEGKHVFSLEAILVSVIRTI